MRVFVFFVAALILAPFTAHADCAADLSDIRKNANSDEIFKLETPRAKALFDKAAKLVDQHNEKDCDETLKGLHQLMNRSE